MDKDVEEATVISGYTIGKDELGNIFVEICGETLVFESQGVEDKIDNQVKGD
jgi:hypothetical protein